MIFIKRILPRNINNNYVKWMNDPEVVRYTEQRYKKHTISEIRKYVSVINKSKNEFLYGIFIKKNKFHIANIKLGPIDFFHKTAELGYIIGEKDYWGKGITKLAIREVIKIAKKKKIKKIISGCYESHKSSIRLFQKCGFIKEGKLRSHYVYQNKRISFLLYAKHI